MKGFFALLNPRLHFTFLIQSFSMLYQYRQLIWEMTRTQVLSQYVGKSLGILWAIVQPVILIAVYVFIFTYVFKAKMGGSVEMPLSFSVYLLSGLIPWLTVSDSLGKSSSVILSNANLVKQMVFPIEILPIKEVLASSITLIVCMVLMIGYVFVTEGGLMLSYLFLPFLILIHLLFMFGLCFILSSVGVYFRDLQNIIEAFLRVGIFIAPIFYLPTNMPMAFQYVLNLNPFAHMVWCYQDVLYFGRLEHPNSWIVLTTLAIGGFYVGYKIFSKLKHGFGEML